MKIERGKVWLGVASVVENDNGEWLVVKKSYSGLKGCWSLPAGFVHQGETVTTAAVREVKEETDIDCEVVGLIGFRTGVIRGDISDNMAIFYCKPTGQSTIVVQEREIIEASWIHPQQLATDSNASVMLVEMAEHQVQRHQLDKIDGVNPGDVFGYSEYQLYFKK